MRKWTRRRIAHTSLLVGGVLVVGTLQSLPAAAERGGGTRPAGGLKKHIITRTEDLYTVPGMTPGVYRLMQTQVGLDRLAAAVRAKAPASGSSGLGGVVVEPEHNRLDLYWHGTVPSAVADEVAKARARGISVVVRSAPYTEARLRAEVNKMTTSPLSAGTASSRRVMTAMAKPDGSGISVGIVGLPAGTTPAAARRLVPALDTSVALDVTVSPRVIPASRALDTWPFWGGAFIQQYSGGNPTGVACTDAFGVTGNNGASTYLLTAAHCGTGEWRSAQINFPDGSTVQNSYGSTIPARDLQHDGEALLPPHPADGAVYFGPAVNPDAGDPGALDGIGVSGNFTSSPGDLVCTSGSFTGTVCNVRVTGTGSLTIDPPENGVGHLVDMVNARSAGVDVAGEGDSGGPVFSLSGNKASARGIITAIDLGSFVVPCQGWVYPGRRCSSSVWYGDVTRIMSALGVKINTG